MPTPDAPSTPDAPDAPVALITGGAGGIGAALATALAGRGYRVAVTDLDEAAAMAVAERVGGLALGLDVTDPAANQAAVAAVTAEYDRLDVIALNAGVSTGHPPGPLNLAAYRRILGVNLDGVVFGVDAALPALRATGGGSILVTASLAGLVPMPSDPYYTLTKTAVVAFVRALAQPLAAERIRINALCPGFTDTAILGATKAEFDAAGFPLLAPADVAAAFLDILDGAAGGEVWFIQPGRAASAYRFHGVPGPVVAAGGTMAPPTLPGWAGAAAARG
ncbi:MAG TPA: SDR family oxidoreductase [Mycobacteriales bacterium]|nr:SDR family oxidoreductase [Mycobacteriales bacterium]